MSQLQTIAVARAISIYRKVARYDPDAKARRGLAAHIKNVTEKGEQDPNRLTVHGLSYLRGRQLQEKLPAKDRTTGDQKCQIGSRCD